MQDDNRKTKTAIVNVKKTIENFSTCRLGACIKEATKSFFLSDTLCIILCDDCFNKVLRQQTDKIKNELCKHEWHGDKDTMKNFCIHCEIQQPELEKEIK